MTITITKKHISLGRKGGADGCPISLAMSEAYKHKTGKTKIIAVGWKSWTPPQGTYYRALPMVARDFILERDAGRTGEPFSFEIDGF